MIELSEKERRGRT